MFVEIRSSDDTDIPLARKISDIRIPSAPTSDIVLKRSSDWSSVNNLAGVKTRQWVASGIAHVIETGLQRTEAVVRYSLDDFRCILKLDSSELKVLSRRDVCAAIFTARRDHARKVAHLLGGDNTIGNFKSQHVPSIVTLAAMK